MYDVMYTFVKKKVAFIYQETILYNTIFEGKNYRKYGKTWDESLVKNKRKIEESSFLRGNKFV